MLARIQALSHPLQIGGVEWLWIVLALAVLLFGSKKIPELARALGRAMGEFHKARLEVEREIRQASESVTSVSPHTTYALGQPEQKEELEKQKVQKAAMAFGINVVGKDVATLKDEIREALGKE